MKVTMSPLPLQSATFFKSPEFAPIIGSRPVALVDPGAINTLRASITEGRVTSISARSIDIMRNLIAQHDKAPAEVTELDLLNNLWMLSNLDVVYDFKNNGGNAEVETRNISDLNLPESITRGADLSGAYYLHLHTTSSCTDLTPFEINYKLLSDFMLYSKKLFYQTNILNSFDRNGRQLSILPLSLYSALLMHQYAEAPTFYLDVTAPNNPHHNKYGALELIDQFILERRVIELPLTIRHFDGYVSKELATPVSHDLAHAGKRANSRAQNEWKYSAIWVNAIRESRPELITDISKSKLAIDCADGEWKFCLLSARDAWFFLQGHKVEMTTIGETAICEMQKAGIGTEKDYEIIRRNFQPNSESFELY